LTAAQQKSNPSLNGQLSPAGYVNQLDQVVLGATHKHTKKKTKINTARQHVTAATTKTQTRKQADAKQNQPLNLRVDVIHVGLFTTTHREKKQNTATPNNNTKQTKNNTERT
jgi:hypothetical protein